jgi:hypothetical protein
MSARTLSQDACTASGSASAISNTTALRFFIEKEFDKADRAFDTRDACEKSYNVNAYWEPNTLRQDACTASGSASAISNTTALRFFITHSLLRHSREKNTRVEKEFDKADRAFDTRDACEKSYNVNAYWEPPAPPAVAPAPLATQLHYVFSSLTPCCVIPVKTIARILRWISCRTIRLIRQAVRSLATVKTTRRKSFTRKSAHAFAGRLHRQR